MKSRGRLACPPRAIIRYNQASPGAEAVLVGGQRQPTPCPRCGRPAEVMRLVVCRDDNFFGNGEKLRKLKARPIEATT
jgi:hypothetical protein